MNKIFICQYFLILSKFSCWTAVIQILVLMSWGRMQSKKMIGPFYWKQGSQDQHQQNSMRHPSNWIWFGHFLWYATSRDLFSFPLLYFKILTFLLVISRFLTMDDSFLLENRATLRAMYVFSDWLKYFMFHSFWTLKTYLHFL